MREIPKDKVLRLIVKEGGIGVINGMVQEGDDIQRALGRLLHYLKDFSFDTLSKQKAYIGIV